ncbi:hypothetical protein [Flavobacterium sp. CAU 1735]|uniref:hypothetical protein n=1 Tax=Flavobacterium sp. CAU 1735 TaxID=3140361 RepID=UPI003260C069
MYTKRNKTTSKKFVFWPKNIGYVLIFWAVIQTLLYFYLDLKWVALPLIPVAVIGLLSLLVFSLKNMQVQKHRSETDMLWNTIVRTSTTWATFLQNSFAVKTEIYQELKNRHQAWLIVLHNQLNSQKENETTCIRAELAPLISQNEIDYIFKQKNSAKQLMALQSHRIKELFDQEIIDNNQHLTLLGHLADYYELQLRCEKTNPHSDNSILATISLFLIQLFILLLPFGLINEFQKIKSDYVLLTIPLCILLSVFFIFTEQQAQKNQKVSPVSF